jgi:KTSC domain
MSQRPLGVDILFVVVIEIAATRAGHEHDCDLGKSPLDGSDEACYKETPPMLRRSPTVLFASILLFATTIAVDASTTRDSVGIISRIKREAVQSSALAAVGYSKRLHVLEIEFVNGAVYRYFDVPAPLHRGLLVAESKARFYDQNIRGKYRSLGVRPRQKT